MFGWLKQIFSPVQRGRFEVGGRVVDENTEILSSTKVVGVTFKNEDGRSRQRLIKKLAKGQVLSLIADPGNPHDKNAVGVFFNQDQIGHLNKSKARKYSPLAQERGFLFAVVEELTGGDTAAGYPTRGVNIAIVDA